MYHIYQKKNKCQQEKNKEFDKFSTVFIETNNSNWKTNQKGEQKIPFDTQKRTKQR